MIELTDREGETARRFGRISEWFVTEHTQRVVSARVGAIAERAVDLLHALSLHLDPAVDLVIESHRDGRRWSGELLALPDVREVVGRLRLLLATYGGVEVTMLTADDQLTLTPELALVIYARSDRWLFILEGLGLHERESTPAAVWALNRRALGPIAELSTALDGSAERLGLRCEPLVDEAA